MSLPIEDITEDIPCPWYKCEHLLSRTQLQSHIDKHKDTTTNHNDSQYDTEDLTNDNDDITLTEVIILYKR